MTPHGRVGGGGDGEAPFGLHVCLDGQSWPVPKKRPLAGGSAGPSEADAQKWSKRGRNNLARSARSCAWITDIRFEKQIFRSAYPHRTLCDWGPRRADPQDDTAWAGGWRRRRERLPLASMFAWTASPGQSPKKRPLAGGSAGPREADARKWSKRGRNNLARSARSCAWITDIRFEKQILRSAYPNRTLCDWGPRRADPQDDTAWAGGWRRRRERLPLASMFAWTASPGQSPKKRPLAGGSAGPSEADARKWSKRGRNNLARSARSCAWITDIRFEKQILRSAYPNRTLCDWGPRRADPQDDTAWAGGWRRRRERLPLASMFAWTASPGQSQKSDHLRAGPLAQVKRMPGSGRNAEGITWRGPLALAPG